MQGKVELTQCWDHEEGHHLSLSQNHERNHENDDNSMFSRTKVNHRINQGWQSYLISWAKSVYLP